MNDAWVALSIQPRIGLKLIRALQQHFGDDLQAALSANLSELQRVPGIGQKTAATIRAIDIEHVQQLITRWRASGIHIIPCQPDAPDYPAALRQIDFPPATLFVRGTWSPTHDGLKAAVIGTRQPSYVAKAAAQQISQRLTRAGYTLVSGLAHGVDGIAHQTACDQAAPTIAVLGCGVLNVYPPEHRDLAENILQTGGALVSEAAPDATVSTPLLVSRNRIISGLSQHVFIIETSIDGGAMHAAQHAVKQGRTLYALDLPHASGNQALIKAGNAHPIAPDLSDLQLPLP